MVVFQENCHETPISIIPAPGARCRVLKRKVLPHLQNTMLISFYLFFLSTSIPRYLQFKYLNGVVFLVVHKEHTIIAVGKTVAFSPPPTILPSLGRTLRDSDPITKAHFKVLKFVIRGNRPRSIFA